MFFYYKRLQSSVEKVFRIWFINFIKFCFWSSVLTIAWINQKISLRKNSSDRECYYQIFIKEVYKGVPENTQYILDLGANIGMSCLYFRKRLPNAKIIAIEPDPINFEQLISNTSESNIVYLKAWAWNGNVPLEINPGSVWDWWSQVRTCETSELQWITIDELLQKFEIPFIDMLKINIEWSEKHLFQSNYESWLQKTKCIAIDLHDRFVSWCSQNFFAAVGKSWSNGYTLSIQSTILIVTRNWNE